jgi:hypothetical protein
MSVQLNQRQAVQSERSRPLHSVKRSPKRTVEPRGLLRLSWAARMEAVGRIRAAQAALNRDGDRRGRHQVREPETAARPHGRSRYRGDASRGRRYEEAIATARNGVSICRCSTNSEASMWLASKWGRRVGVGFTPAVLACARRGCFDCESGET